MSLIIAKKIKKKKIESNANFRMQSVNTAQLLGTLNDEYYDIE